MIARQPQPERVSHYDVSSSADEANLRDALKRCSPETIEAAIAFRATGRAEYVPVVVVGVIERYVERDLRPKLKYASDELRLVEDLALDSLTMMETVVLLEEVLQVNIHNEELRALRTVGDVKEFVDCKVRGLPLPPRWILQEHPSTDSARDEATVDSTRAALAPAPSPFASKATNATVE